MNPRLAAWHLLLALRFADLVSLNTAAGSGFILIQALAAAQAHQAASPALFAAAALALAAEASA